MSIRALAKVLILMAGIFPAWSLNKFFNFFKLECTKKDQTYVSDILTLFEYILRIKIKHKCGSEDDLDFYLNGPNFTRNEIIIPVLLIKAIFGASYSLEGLSFSSQIRVSAKVLILPTRIFLLRSSCRLIIP